MGDTRPVHARYKPRAENALRGTCSTHVWQVAGEIDGGFGWERGCGSSQEGEATRGDAKSRRTARTPCRCWRRGTLAPVLAPFAPRSGLVVSQVCLPCEDTVRGDERMNRPRLPRPPWSLPWPATLVAFVHAVSRRSPLVLCTACAALAGALAAGALAAGLVSLCRSCPGHPLSLPPVPRFPSFWRDLAIG